ncbi:MAG: D-glycero-beta-D-manno-heptose 1-phosphate adenylyltransferase [Candidatus Omnitrophica bacterium]|nr:D-glycero-beta-D-manno-heptose 1-phosphate adenylyltransferase [Candidatus Omnitrophota bacterium]MBU4302887.1 D-glycero-beta-D-manno-heptose 1-phosphate adenylyltransferase [Candidatus Omnitrophota bacterium]MBU4418850.1 D-glycero-beta-D-manno-heptose 1-phosphate adenylyltransferase [Candidatus Omnitrophota bacterium]MBU4468757.1 D-glycero-beta-D-manno-heptose 1-phosphate adenylyltransferase [Candidatus Omnitrophota bacterium]MCG2708249.1 D-glycero-beta-D-manno-heptose 1-phosphate adenylylt
MRNDRAGALSGTKIISTTSLKRKVRRLKQNGKRIVFTNGCFDILHYGHVKYLQDARSYGDYLVVAVNSDSSVKKIKAKNRPVIKQGDRLKTVAALASVDFVVLFNENNPLRLIKALKPDILIKGADWSKKKIIGADFVASYGGKVLTVNLVKGRSTSALIEKIVRNFSKK